MLKFLVLLTVLVAVNAGGSPNGIRYLTSLSDEEFSKIPKEIIEDSLLNVTQLVEKYGYPVEVHEVETEDGYVITMQRIPGGKTPISGDKIPVLLMHGLLSSSADWIINGPEKSLGYILADAGYDVWLGNARGNFYSRKHVTLSPDDKKFWDFSWNEIGYYDLPAMISYITELTEYDEIHYVGHSQGTTAFFVMGATRPEYNEKIILMQGLGPACFLDNARSPILKAAPYIKPIEKLFDMLGFYEILPHTPLMTTLANTLCSDDSIFQPICLYILFTGGDSDPNQFNVTMLPVYISHAPAGASFKQPIHYAQVFNSMNFRNYDFGADENMELYGSEIPPNYDLSLVTAPVALHYGDNDYLVDPLDVQHLYEELGNPIGKFRVPLAEFNHIDFIWAINARTLLYDRMLSLMKIEI